MYPLSLPPGPLPAQDAHRVTKTMSQLITADTVRLYLTELGKTPLLTRAEEVALARDIEDAGAELRRLVLGSPVAMRQVKIWADLIARRQMSPKELMPRGS